MIRGTRIVQTTVRPGMSGRERRLVLPNVQSALWQTALDKSTISNYSSALNSYLNFVKTP